MAHAQGAWRGSGCVAPRAVRIRRSRILPRRVAPRAVRIRRGRILPGRMYRGRCVSGAEGFCPGGCAAAVFIRRGRILPGWMHRGRQRGGPDRREEPAE